jgi:short subunit dehydrogenase-like uncharacterized protein
MRKAWNTLCRHRRRNTLGSGHYRRVSILPFLRLHFAELSYRYDYAATKSGAIIIPCSGFDSVPSDISAYLANKTLKAVVGPDTAIESSTSAWRLRSGISGGTLQTAMSALEEVPREKFERSMKDYILSPGECP